MRVKGVSEGCGVVVWGKEGYFSQISDSLSATRRLSWFDSSCLFLLAIFCLTAKGAFVSLDF